MIMIKKVDMVLLNENVRVTNNAIFIQDFETKDGVIVVKAHRVGGGFGCGTTYYDVFKNKKQELRGVGAEKAYGFVQDYIKNRNHVLRKEINEY